MLQINMADVMNASVHWTPYLIAIGVLFARADHHLRRQQARSRNRNP